jgi:hypothetical protein
VLDRLFYGGAVNGCDKDLASLRKQNLLSVVENAIPDPENQRSRLSYYCLTTPGAAEIAVPPGRAGKSGPESLPRNLAILWFCCMRKQRAHRLEKNEVAELFPDKRPLEKLPNLHCLVSNGKHRLLNIYVPQTSVAEAKSELRKRLVRANEVPCVAEAMQAHQYGFLVLVETAELRDALKSELGSVFGRSRVGYFVTLAPGTWNR